MNILCLEPTQAATQVGQGSLPSEESRPVHTLGLQRTKSTYCMIERGPRCCPTIDLYQAQWKCPDEKDRHICGAMVNDV
jgi:hypothetical protein